MSWQSCPDPALGDMHGTDPIETVIVPRTRDLGGFEVRRALLPGRGKWSALSFSSTRWGLPSSASARELMPARSIAHNSTFSESFTASVSSVSR
jgi:hypothetical protein